MRNYDFLNAQPWRLKVKNNSSTFIIPSVYTLHDANTIHARRKVQGKEFLFKALNGVQFGLEGLYPAKVRAAVLDNVSEARKFKNLHFKGSELANVYNLFYTIIKHEIRPMEPRELIDFLYLNLRITNTITLNGLYRAAIKYVKGPDAKIVGRMTPHVFVYLLSILLRGNLEERATLAFYVADVDGDNNIRARVEIDTILKTSFDPYIAASAPEIDPYEPFRDTSRFLSAKLNLLGDSKVNRQDFVRECIKAPWLIDGLVPIIPEEIANLSLQSVISPTPRLPPIEKRMIPQNGQQPNGSTRRN